MKSSNLHLLIALAAFGFFVASCANAPQFQVSSQSNLTQNDDDDPVVRVFDNPPKDTDPKDDDKDPKDPTDPGGPTVCDPLDQDLSGDVVTDRNGLLGKLSYLASGEPIAQSVWDFWSIDQETNEILAKNSVDATIFNQWLNVPTRRFEQGFFTLGEQADALLRADNSVLDENFSLYFESNLVLGNADPGRYEIAVLSDDGSILYLWDGKNGGGDFILNNDGNHPTRMGCSTDEILLDENTQIPLELLYHQGPKYHIALVVMWRKLKDGEIAGQDPSCGLTGNNVYFDYGTASQPKIPSVPKQAYLDLLDRGWEVIPPSSYLLPGDMTNPCPPEE